MDAAFTTVEFPTEIPLGSIYARKVGRKRWMQYSSAKGSVPLLKEREYQLRVSWLGFMFDSNLGILQQIDLDHFQEVIIQLPVSERDWWDQAICGIPYVKKALSDAQQFFESKLKTTAKICVKPDLLPEPKLRD